MEFNQFDQNFRSILSEGRILQNPGGGDSTIVSYTLTQLIYRRGNSKIYISIADLFKAYKEFSGKTVSSTDLKKYAPKIFDSTKSGHSCNCTLFFMALKAMGVITRIEGAGKSGNPFRVKLP
jgi:hypothetical protein